MPSLSIRWSQIEAQKEYSRPFGVTFIDNNGQECGSIAVSGHDLLYYEQFQHAVLLLGGEIFRHPIIERAKDNQKAWLDFISQILAPFPEQYEIIPVSYFDQDKGRTFHVIVNSECSIPVTMEPASLLGYQEFQAQVAHQTGFLYRNKSVENIEDFQTRQNKWRDVISECIVRPSKDDAMSVQWPWR